MLNSPNIGKSYSSKFNVDDALLAVYSSWSSVVGIPNRLIFFLVHDLVSLGAVFCVRVTNAHSVQRGNGLHHRIPRPRKCRMKYLWFVQRLRRSHKTAISHIAVKHQQLSTATIMCCFWNSNIIRLQTSGRKEFMTASPGSIHGKATPLLLYVSARMLWRI